VHGHEANIVLFSLTRNIPGQPFNIGFVRQKEQLRVKFSRVRMLMVTFGNLIEQVKGVCDGHQDFEKGRKGETFGLILKEFADTGDLLSSQHLAALIQGTVVGKKSADVRPRGRRNPRSLHRAAFRPWSSIK
jgi:hypothetical protein